ncbi:SSI family serine proteinase inhibitor [Nonomuraea fuscirosea]|uniref:SSI family serine proteinase inhibitor n=1 Tax=Nonomuraea fuscirosea TaxID=1291556 RepID=UPI002DDA465F|nr:SSI family serine proteinase inhibitor [Nonomuraea fuscirosea]WSA54407.1 subtilase-type protease inhibitor [Nonomuraea fuscirosea]
MTLVLTAARRLAALGLCVAATFAVPFTALPAQAAAGAELFITVTPRAGGAYATRLTCDPDGGVHPHPRAACDALHGVDGHVHDLNVDPGPCPLIFDPVEVEVKGHWYGRPTSFHETFSNRCDMDRRLGPLV